jgi:hypothetical protein
MSQQISSGENGQSEEPVDVRGFLWLGFVVLLLVQLLPMFYSYRPLLSWGISLAIITGVLKESRTLSDSDDRQFCFRWALTLLALPVGGLLFSLALDSNYLAEAAGSSLVAPGVPAVFLGFFALYRARSSVSQFRLRRQDTDTDPTVDPE